MDLSFPENLAVNDGIDKDKYLNNEIRLELPKVQDLVDIVKQKGRGCKLFKVDLQ